MAFDMTQWQEHATKIVAAQADQAALTALVVQAGENYGELFATQTETAKQNETLKAENEALRRANMDLFLRIGQDTAQRAQPGSTPQEKSRAETITIADLFKPRGE